MLLENTFITVSKNESLVKLASYYLMWRRVFCACVCVSASVRVDRLPLCSANKEHHLGSYIISSK